MLQEFQLTGKTWTEIAEVCEPERKTWIGPSKHFRWDRGVPTCNFGKHCGVPLAELAAQNRGYLDWMTCNDFPPHVIEICQAALNPDAAGLQAWLESRFGAPPAWATTISR